MILFLLLRWHLRATVSITTVAWAVQRGFLDEIFTKIQRNRANRKLNMAAGKHRENFHGGLIEGIVKFYG